eukprot:m.216740 g.216740  ORF g.216740 m.216740 type:complete len:379 (-) comp15881_c0_seq5:320-1456(-)
MAAVLPCIYMLMLADTFTNYSSDVVVYGATAAGCMSAIAASRSGARNVILVNPYEHVGGMTTGGLMHADTANTSTIGGLTLEFFDRVLAHYPNPTPNPTPNPSSERYTCLGSRCINLQDTDKRGSSNATCDNKCPALKDNEWLAVTFLSELSNNNQTLTVRLPKGQNISYLKKSEKLEHQLPASMYKQIYDGQVFQLAKPVEFLEYPYYLIELNSTKWKPKFLRDGPLHPGSFGQIGKPWLYESHIAEMVLNDMLLEANVTVISGVKGLESFVKQGTALKSVTSVTGLQFSASVWIDGSYEGDLAYIAEADMTWGRESQVSSDKYNGVFKKFFDSPNIMNHLPDDDQHPWCSTYYKILDTFLTEIADVCDIAIVVEID